MICGTSIPHVDLKHLPRRRRLATLVVGLGFLIAASSAYAAPSVTMAPPGPVVGHIPVFTITATPLSPPGTTVAWTLTGPGYSELGDPLDAALPVTASPPQSIDDGLYTFTATEAPAAASQTVVTFTLDTTPPPVPTITSGPPAVVGPAPPITFGWTGDTTAISAEWQLLDLGNVVLSGTTPASHVTFSLPLLAPGDRILRLRVRLLDAVGNPSPFSDPYVFNVDQTPPGPPIELTGPTGITRNLAPEFSWQGTQLGGVYQWDVLDASGTGILGPGVNRTTSSSSVTVPSLPLAPNMTHNLVFTVRQIDAYGNHGPVSKLPFTVTTVPIPTIAPPPPKTRSASLMTPSAGSNLTTLRPLLRWRKIVRGTTLYNIQVYDGKTKVLSMFPRTIKTLVPKGKLKPGKRYIWYVWAYVGKKKQYAARPMMSWFETAR